jgi:hypothetical protein
MLQEAVMTAGRFTRRTHRTLVARIGILALGVVTTALGACSGDSTLGPNTDPSTAQTPGGGGDTSGTTPPQTSNGPVASVVVSPKQVSIPQGYYTHFLARPLDSKGITVSGKRAQWRSSDANVAVASDTGVVYGKAVGTAKIYGTVDGHADSATVTVTTPLPPPPDTVVTVPAPVSSFTLNVVTLGLLPGPDTLATEPVAGATITVTRVAGINGDTLNPSVSAGTAVTNTRGEASFRDLPGGYYTILATPPSGSPYRVTTWGLGAPRTSVVNVRIVLRR